MRYFQLCNIFVENFLLLSSLLFFTGNVSAQDNDRAFETAKNISIFNSVLKELNTLYVDTFDLNKMVEKGINTMLYTLDPYTTYIPETETEDFKFMTTGEYGGIGSLITPCRFDLGRRGALRQSQRTAERAGQHDRAYRCGTSPYARYTYFRCRP